MFPERLKQLRKEKGLTQVMLAETLGVSKGTVAMWETGKRMPGFDMLARLSELFDKRVDYIIGTSEDHRSATLTEEEVAQLGEWAVKEDYEDMLRKYALLDDYGKSAVDSVLRTEFNRSQEQGTLNSSMSLSVSVRSKPIKDHT
ncbi:MAG: helix-turn-helix domain-containing protein [Lachnospiraceae bacterium]|nr:helix-turn-helix domain-containing protein [Lachnospiraceae bacterium]